MGGCPIKSNTHDLDNSSMRKKRFQKTKKKARNHKEQAASKSHSPMRHIPIEPRRKTVQFPMDDDVDQQQDCEGGRCHMLDSMRESTQTEQLYQQPQSEEDQCISTVRNSDKERKNNKFNFKQEVSIEVEKTPEEDSKKKREQEIVLEFQQRLNSKLEDERLKMKKQYDEEYQRMQLMLKIQAKQIEMLRNEQQSEDAQSVNITNKINDIQLSKDTNPQGIQGGDTGGPPSSRSIKSRKKVDLTINLPEIDSPNFVRNISTDNEDQMPDIIKQIRRSASNQNGNPFQNGQSPFSESNPHLLNTKKSLKKQRTATHLGEFSNQKQTIYSPQTHDIFQFQDEDLPLRRPKRTKTVDAVLEPQFRQEIEDYLQNCLENNEDTIDMSDTLILDQGAQLVADVAPVCDRLKTIRLKQCRISDVGAIKLFEELKEHKTLTLLDLSYNPITEKSQQALAELLKVNQNLQVNLCMNGFKANHDLAPVREFIQEQLPRLIFSNETTGQRNPVPNV